MYRPRSFYLSFFLVPILFFRVASVWAGPEFKPDPESWANEGRDFEEFVWKETKLPLPPYPLEDDLLEVPESASNKTFKVFVDRKHLFVSEDYVIHYTVVAVSRSGSKNVLFEGLRCDDGLYKVYGYGTSKGKVVVSDGAEWKYVGSSRRQDYRIRFRQNYMCGKYGQTASAEKILYRLEHDKSADLDGGEILGGEKSGW